LKNLNLRHPVLQTFADSPIYSNAAWRLVTMALEKITGKSFEYLFQAAVEDLALNSTSDKLPESDINSYIPVDSSISWYDADLRAYTPGGGVSDPSTAISAPGDGL
jgi:CubicO group peptidase (beta-lactamase class C family)